ncbi:uncharacterized protein Z519_02588 [Cladophialophora bantiana CBS 173.52]|uniref:Fungal N-terminal domain-containing protein n=1 Tax=Cladophialophora bantiana (strain ATCC 10958 / CBS 173.52 / CDC B-1940 / NIH 8579) TaxID=1442370 RepID=A0A0D2F4N7_CLAB1|nr:uncharacterized protein Z519_02588 [Cladophialophora bantiana CBS 173.52]KIW97196.1 hypothetical protein Z519_02588 [Cladophialophora bantiana CBS 173.52]
MPAPLSIAATVAGLLEVTYSVSITLTSLCISVLKAPGTIQDVLNETRDLTSILRQLESYLKSSTITPQWRTSLPTLEEGVTTLTDCVCAQSGLEPILNRIRTENMGAIDRLRWMWYSDGLANITQRIDSHQMPLALMLNTLTW